MTKHHFSIKEVFTFGYNKLVQHAWFVFLTGIISSIIVSATIPNPLLVFIVGTMVGLSLVSISLMIVRNHSFSFSDLTTPLLSYKRVLKFFALTSFYMLPVLFLSLTGAIIVFGAANGSTSVTIFGLILTMIFFVISVFITVRLKFFPYIVIEHEYSSVKDLILMSYKLTQNNFWKLLLFILAAAVLNTLGALFFLVGLVVTVPITAFASAHLYDKFKSHSA